MNKQEIIDKFKDTILQKHQLLEAKTSETFQEANEAEGAMQSQHDPFKNELTSLGNALRFASNEIQGLFNELNNFGQKTCQKGEPGALIAVDGLFNAKIAWFLLVTSVGGEKIEYNGMAISTLMVNSPIGICLKNKKKDDTIECNLKGEMRQIKVAQVL